MKCAKSMTGSPRSMRINLSPSLPTIPKPSQPRPPLVCLIRHTARHEPWYLHPWRALTAAQSVTVARHEPWYLLPWRVLSASVALVTSIHNTATPRPGSASQPSESLPVCAGYMFHVKHLLGKRALFRVKGVKFNENGLLVTCG